jgi:hypothetical protein
MREKLYADIRTSSFEEFIDFLFGRPVLPQTENRSQAWYFNTEVAIETQRVCSYYIQLFLAPGFLYDRFTKQQMEQAFSAMTVRSLSCSVKQVIWNTDLPFHAREECVRSMLHLFPAVFAIDRLGHTASMWWDAFCFDRECGTKRRARGGEDAMMQDVLFQTLSDVLRLDSTICIGSALHGLEHLHHPETKQLMDDFLKAHPDLDELLKTYAKAIGQDDPLWMRRI